MTVFGISDGGDATGATYGWDELSGSVAVTTDQAHTGTRSILFDTGASALTAYLARFSGIGTANRWSAWFRLRDLPSSHQLLWMVFNGSVTVRVFGLTIDSSNRVRLTVNGTASTDYVGTIGPALSEDTWYRISAAWSVTSTTSWSAKVWVDGTLAVSASNTDATLGAADPTYGYWGYLTQHGGNPVANIGLYFDDFILDNGSGVDDIGNIIVAAKPPTAAGTSGFDTGIGSGTNRWDRVSEVPISETNGWREATPASPLSERLPPDAVLASSALTGATVANLDDDPDAGGTDFATATSNNTAVSVRVSFGTPSITPSGTQEFRAQVKKNAASGTGTPTAQIDLYENGVLISSGTPASVTSTTGQVISRTWDMTGRTASQIEALVSGTASGGSPGARASVDIGAIEWNAAAPAAAALETYQVQAQGSGVDLSSGTLVARMAWVWAKASAAGTAYLIDNGTETAISLTTTSALYTRLTDTATYPSGTDQIGLRAVDGDTDTDLYECGAIIAAVVPTGPATYTGSGTPSLAALTGAGTGSHTAPTYSGSGAASVAAVTASGTGSTAVEYVGSGAPALAAATASGTGTHTAPTYTGTGTPLLAAVSASGTGTHTAPVYSGSGVASLAAVAGAGSGSHTAPVYSGASAASIAALSAAGAGSHTAPTYTGAGAASLAAASAAGTGAHIGPTYAGTGASSLAAVTASGIAAVGPPTYTGDGAVSTAAATATGSGTHTAPTYIGNGAPSLAAATAAGTGTHTAPTYAGSGSGTLAAVTASAAGLFATVEYTGSAAVSLAAVTSAGTGAYDAGTFTATGAVTLAAVTSAGSGSHIAPTYTGSGAATLAAMQTAATGTHTAPVYTGVGAVTLGTLIAAGAGAFAPTFIGTGAVSVAVITAAGVGAFSEEIYTPRPEGTIAIVLGPGATLAAVQGPDSMVTAHSPPEAVIVAGLAPGASISAQTPGASIGSATGPGATLVASIPPGATMAEAIS
jgi:adhesin/invasin